MASISRSNVEQFIREGTLFIESDIDEIEKDAFLPLSYITNLKIMSENSKFLAENNCLYDSSNGILYFAASEKNEKIVIPSAVKKINMYAFPAGVKEIESVPSAVQEIPIKAAKAWELKSFIEKRNQLVKSKREKIAALKAAISKKS